MFTEMIFLSACQKEVNLQNKRSTFREIMINRCHESGEPDSKVLIFRERRFLCDKSRASANTSGWGRKLIMKKADNKRREIIKESGKSTGCRWRGAICSATAEIQIRGIISCPHIDLLLLLLSKGLRHSSTCYPIVSLFLHSSLDCHVMNIFMIFWKSRSFKYMVYQISLHSPTHILPECLLENQCRCDIAFAISPMTYH